MSDRKETGSRVGQGIRRGATVAAGRRAHGHAGAVRSRTSHRGTDRSRVLCLTVATTLASLAPGCSEPSRNIAFESTRAGSIMKRIRERHGGVETFRRFAGVCFSYRVGFRGQTRSFETVGFRFADFGHLWIQEEPDAPLLVVAVPRQAHTLRGKPVVGAKPATARTNGSASPRSGVLAEGPVRQEVFSEPELDLALRSIRFLLEPSLTTSVGPWRFRTLMATADVDVSERIEIEPWPSYVVDGNYLLETDPESGLLRQILYRGNHPVIRGRTQVLSLEEYACVQGIHIALRRVHRRPPDEAQLRLARNPFRLPPSIREETFLTEELDRVRFLTPDEVDDVLPLPPKDDRRP